MKKESKVNSSSVSQNTTSEYLLLFRGTDWYERLSAEEIQKVMDAWYSWFDRLMQQKKLKVGQPLGPGGKVVSGAKGRHVADGPFTESKETIGGYFLLQVGTIDEAVAIARECPGLDYGLSVEVRPVIEYCHATELIDEHYVPQRS
jgi:hypothetical protein